MKNLFIHSLLCLSLLGSLSTFAAGTAKKKSHVKLTSARSKSLDLEGAVVESMNKHPLDSMDQMVEETGAKGNHLYSKPAHFQPENRRTLQRARYQ